PLSLFFFYSCKKEDRSTTKPEIKITAADSINAYPGLHHMVLSWTVKDPTVKKAVAYCDNGDSIAIPYNSSDVMSAAFNHLEEGNYSFSIYLYDDQGRTSARAKIVAHVYGDSYVQSLTSRSVNDAIYNKGDVSVVRDKPAQNMLGTEIRYLN